MTKRINRRKSEAELTRNHAGRSRNVAIIARAAIVGVILGLVIVNSVGCGPLRVSRERREAADARDVEAGRQAAALEGLGLSIGWARTWGGIDNDFSYGTAVDGDGGVYIVGRFWDTVDFDPGPGAANRTSRGRWDGFLVKYDSEGGYQWVRTWGTEERDQGARVAADGFGNVYLVGRFWQILPFDAEAEMELRAVGGGWGLYLVKFDSSGDSQWSVVWCDDEDWAPESTCRAAADGMGDVYLTGGFSGSVDFDPGPSRDVHSSQDGRSAFLVKLNASGEFQWARTWDGEDSRGDAIAVDDSSRVYVLGHFKGTVDFNPGEGIEERVASGDPDIYLSAFDSDGDFQWVRTWGGPGSMSSAPAITLDANGDVYVAGAFSGTVDFDPGEEEENRTSNGSYDVFVGKFDSSGEFQWVTTWGGTEWDGARGIAADEAGRAYVTGYFENTVDFEAVAESEEGVPLEFGGAFLTRLGPDGEFDWDHAWGATHGMAHGFGIALDCFGEVLVTGIFGGSVFFDDGEGTIEHESEGALDVFLIRLGTEEH